VNDLVIVEVLHARGDLLGPIDQPHGRDLVRALPQEVEEWTVRAKLHDDAVARRLGANATKLKDNYKLLGSLSIICVFNIVSINTKGTRALVLKRGPCGQNSMMMQ
jgi:hypothetical protein